MLVVLLLASEWSRGRFAPLTPQAASQPGWLEENLLRHPAELIGAVWDRGVGSDEVAATIARLAGEGKLETRVDGEQELHMKLKVDRNTLGGHERALVDGFFFDGRRETSTTDVKSHYKKTGFNPTGLIQPALEAQAKELVGPPAQSKWLPLWLPTLVAFVWAMYLFWTAAPATAEGRLPRFLGIGLPMLVLSGIASAMAASWRARIDRGPRSVIRFLIPGGLMLLFAGAVVTGFRDVPILSHVFGSGFSFDVRLGATLLALALFNSMINQARSRERAQGIALRKRLASARRYFQEELDRPQPALRDEWFPYVLAFGLDKDAQDWFKAHGGAVDRATRPRPGRARPRRHPRPAVARRAARRPAGAAAAARSAEPAPRRRGRWRPAPSRPAWRLLRRPGARAAAAVGEAAEAAAAVAAAEAGSGGRYGAVGV